MTKAKMRHWLFKSEPHVFSIDDLASAPGKKTGWTGVRNYQARNTLRDDVQVGDAVLFYHSSTAEPAIVGRAEVVRSGYPDPTAWDETNAYYDPKSDPENPRWYMVDIKFVEKFRQPLPLALLRNQTQLQNMVLLQKGSRLSVQPVTPAQYAAIVALAGKD